MNNKLDLVKHGCIREKKGKKREGKRIKEVNK